MYFEKLKRNHIERWNSRIKGAKGFPSNTKRFNNE